MAKKRGREAWDQAMAAEVGDGGRGSKKRASLRARKVSKALKMVDADTRREVEIGRLQALEEEQDFGGDPDDQDEAYHVSEDEGASSDEGADVKPPAAGRTSRAAKNKAKAAITTTQPKALSRGPSSSAGGPRAFGSAARSALLRRRTKTLVRHLTDAAYEAPEVVSAYFHAATADPGVRGRRFCSVCGFRAKYTCVRCGSAYCRAKCLGTHKETRCMKVGT